MVIDAVARNFEIIGEAANSINGKPVFISKTFKTTTQKLNELINRYKLKELKLN